MVHLKNLFSDRMETMIANQIISRGIKDTQLIEAMRKVVVKGKLLLFSAGPGAFRVEEPNTEEALASLGCGNIPTTYSRTSYPNGAKKIAAFHCTY